MAAARLQLVILRVVITTNEFLTCLQRVVDRSDNA